jgi:hypothetical protein
MSSVVSEIYDWLKAVRDADITGTGLNNGSSPAYVAVFARKDDPNFDRNNTQYPLLTVTANPNNTDRFGADVYTMDVRMYITVDRDNQLSNMDSIIERIRLKYHRQAVTAGTLYWFSNFQVRNIVDLQASGKYLNKMIVCRTIAKKR